VKGRAGVPNSDLFSISNTDWVGANQSRHFPRYAGLKCKRLI
jgi:hypothetical protein